MIESNGTGRPLIEVRDVRMYFPVTTGIVFQRKVAEVKAVDSVSLAINKGEVLGLVGESGSGKTTLGRVILQLLRQTSGDVFYDGQRLNDLSHKDLRPIRRKMQVIFQDPYGSLNPRMTCGDIVGEPLSVHKLTESKGEYQDRVSELLQTVGLNPFMADRYPHEFSGGQRQRIGIARALAVSPDFIVCDEPVSALDVSHSGADHQPAGRTQGKAPAYVPLHRPRPVGGAAHQRQGGGHVPRPHRRGGEPSRALR